MVNQDVLDHITRYCKKNNWTCNTADEYLETLQDCGKELYRKNTGGSRWWNNYFCVTQLDGLEIGYYDAETTGDRSPQDTGWEFQIQDICRVQRHEEIQTVVTYTKAT